MFLKRKFIISFIFFKNTYIFFQVREWSSVFPACELFLRRLWTLSSGSNPKTSSSSENPMSKSTMSTKGRDQPSPEIIIKLSSQVWFESTNNINNFWFHKVFYAYLELQIGALFDIFCGVFRMAGVQNNRYLRMIGLKNIEPVD